MPDGSFVETDDTNAGRSFVETESERIYSCPLGIFNLGTDSAYVSKSGAPNSAATANNGNALVCNPDDCTDSLHFAGSDDACQSLVTDKECTQRCLHGWSSNSNGFRDGEGPADTDTTRRTVAHYTCKSGSLAGDDPLMCEAELCTQRVPVGVGFDTACADLRTEGTCTQKCAHGFTDNNGGNGQVYDCNKGVFHGVLLTCEAQSCAHLVAKTEHHDSGCEGLVSGGNCTARCMAGYGTIDGDGQIITSQEHSCMAGELSGNLLVCLPLPCNMTLDLSEAYEGECLSLQTGETCTHRCGDGYSNKPYRWNTNAPRTYPNKTAGPLETSLSCPGGVLTGTPLRCFPQNCTANFTTEDGNLNQYYYDINDCDHLMSGGSCELKCIDGFASNNPQGADFGLVYTCPNGGLTTVNETELTCTAPMKSTGFTTAQTVGTSLGGVTFLILIILLLICQINQCKRRQDASKVSAQLSGIGTEGEEEDDLQFDSSIILDAIGHGLAGAGAGAGAGANVGAADAIASATSLDESASLGAADLPGTPGAGPGKAPATSPPSRPNSGTSIELPAAKPTTSMVDSSIIVATTPKGNPKKDRTPSRDTPKLPNKIRGSLVNTGLKLAVSLPTSLPSNRESIQRIRTPSSSRFTELEGGNLDEDTPAGNVNAAKSKASVSSLLSQAHDFEDHEI